MRLETLKEVERIGKMASFAEQVRDTLYLLEEDETSPEQEVLEWALEHGDDTFERFAEFCERDGSVAAVSGWLETLAYYLEELRDDPELIGWEAPELDSREVSRTAATLAKAVRDLLAEAE